MMTRLPVPGATKTRMMPALTAEECAALHLSFLKDYDGLAASLKGRVNPFVYYAPEHATEDRLSALPLAGERLVQRGDTLGDRMRHAFDLLFVRGYEQIVLVGTDIPHLTPGVIEGAFDTLETADAVIGPTDDGGYYLIGKRAPFPELFSKKLGWGERSVLEETLGIAEESKIRMKTVDRMTDIDTIEDLLSLVGEDGSLPDQPQHTVAFLRNWLNEKGAGDG
jgi:rSAM/selenodomain-associated transferase 1